MKELLQLVLFAQVFLFPVYAELDTGYATFCSYMQTKYAWQTPSRNEAIYRASLAERLDPYFMAAHIHAESRGNPRAVSRSGARGLYQIMPFWVDDPDILFNEWFNIQKGARIFRNYLDRARGNVVLALKYYERGPGGAGYNYPYIMEIMTNSGHWTVYLPEETIARL